MLKKAIYISLLFFITSLSTIAQDADFDGVDDTIDLCPNTAGPNTDTDGDGIGDLCDSDDDNDGILDIYDCEVAIQNYSFEDGLDHWNVLALGGYSSTINPADDGLFQAADGTNYLDLEDYGQGVSLTTLNASAVYSETGYVFEIALGDLPFPVGSTVNPSFFNDGQIRIELGYGDNSTAFTTIPNATLDIDGDTETIEGWNEFSIPFTLNYGNSAIGQGILIRITHTGRPWSAVGLAVDFVRLSLDSDGDGISNCKEVDSDKDGCFDVVEAGHTDAGGGILGTTIDANGLVTGAPTGYTGNTQEVLETNPNNICNPFYKDNDEDGVNDNDDLDDDNDGILDIYECEISLINNSFENNGPGDPITGWSLTNNTNNVSWGIEVPTLTNFHSVPNGNSIAFINGSGTITLNLPGAAFEPGNYITSIDIGDGIETLNRYSNDGQSLIEIGYNDGTGFQIVNSLAIEGFQTQNGTWANFFFETSIPIGSPIIGEGILVQITHTENFNLIQSGGSYDNIQIKKDRNSNHIPDCFEDDIDNDNCSDVQEAGHIDAGGGVLGTTVAANGLVTGALSGYTGINQAVLSSAITSCKDNLDFDNDGINNLIDLDDDNDGVLDIYECEVPIPNYSFETSNIPSNPIEYWQVVTASPGSNYGIETVNGANFINAQEGNSYGFINGDITIELEQVWATYDREGDYILEFSIGDPLGFSQQYSNDSQTIVELGYTNGTNFSSFATPGSTTIESYQTPNGQWSRFFITVAITKNTAGFGQGISIRITQKDNSLNNTSQTTFDNFTLKIDTDGDGYPDCTDLDSDSANTITGCPDVIEAGHTDAGGGILGTTVDVNGVVTGAPTGYTGPRHQMWDESKNPLCDLVDTDGDSLYDGDSYYFLPNGYTYWDQYDVDNDNDGILDTDEGCNLTTAVNEQPYNFEFPSNDNFNTNPNYAPFARGVGPNGVTGYLDFWVASNPAITGPSLVNWNRYTNPNTSQPYPQNYFTDGTLQADIAGLTTPSSTNNDQYAFIDGDGSLTQNTSSVTLEEGSYIITTAVGDALGVVNPYSNDGSTLLESGYGSVANFIVLGQRTVRPEETPNGSWTDISYSITIPAGSAAIGQQLLLRITHTANLDANQSSGNYDYIRIQFDYDGDGIPDCLDSDSDNDGCPDATEAGFDNDDNNDYAGTGTPTVTNGTVNPNNGTVTGTNGYTTPVSPNVRSYAEPVTLTPLTNETACTNSNITFNAIATRVAGDIDYAWYESTDGGATFTQLTEAAPFSGTASENMTITSVTTGQNNNQYRVRVTGDDYLCYEESIATLSVNTGPTAVTLTAVNTAICAGEDSEFTLTGDTDDIVSYSLDGGATTNTRTIGATGSETITVTAPTANTTLSISSVEDGATACILTITPATTATVTVNAIPTAPINPVNNANCEGNTNNAISIELDTLGTGDTINWYTTATGGTALGSGLTYTSPETVPGIYTYYAEAEVLASGCVSATRVAVTFTISASITADTLIVPPTCDSYTLPALNLGNNYYTGPGATGTLLNPGNTITTSQTIYIYAETGTTPNCTDESFFDVLINETPTLTIQTISCSPDLLTYEVVLDTFLGVLTTSAGTIVGNTITAIPAGTDIIITSTNNGCATNDVSITAPNCSCPILDVPETPINGSNCEGNTTATLSVTLPSTGGDVINWYDVASGGTVLATGLTYTPTDIAAGNYVYYTETFDATTSCASTNRTPVTLTITAIPVADVLVDQTSCDTYTLPTLVSGNYYTGTGATGTALNPGDTITTSQTIYIYAASGTTPNCTDESSFAVTINKTPILTIDTISCSADLTTYDVVFDAFDGVLTSSSGTVVGNTITSIPSGTDIIVTATNNGCTTNNFPITAPDCSCPALDAPENPIDITICEGVITPALSVSLPPTSGDAINWYRDAFGGAILETNTNYTPADNAPGSYTYYAETFDTTTGCSSIRIPVQLTIYAIPTVNNLPDITTCDSYALPILGTKNEYYTGPRATGTLLKTGDVITTTQTIYIYASSGTTPNCADESSFVVTIDETPNLLVVSKKCSIDFSTYTVVIENFTGILTSSEGTVVDNNTITNIPAGEDITITGTNNVCSSTLNITAPDCNCPVLDAPINPVNGRNCEAKPTAQLSVSVPTSGGNTIVWYETPFGGNPIGTGENFTPIVSTTGTYTYFAETTDNISSCASETRTPVTLTITALPSISPKQDIEACEIYILPPLETNEFYYTDTNASGERLKEGEQITNSQTIYVFSQSQENTSCTIEVAFNVTILQEPILDIPNSLSLCVQENGSNDPLYLGTDLGPGYRYDWSPDNDTNGDGIEEALFEITEPGDYSLEIYQIGTTTECGGFTTYTTTIDEVPQPLALNVEVVAEGYMLDSGNRVRLLVNDDPLTYSQFEYSITSAEGPFQESNIFPNVDGGLYTGYVRAISGCGNVVDSKPFLIVNYPTFFTPNGDGKNETWKPLGLDDLNISSNIEIDVFDRHGKLLAKLNPLGVGWNGNYNNAPMSSSDYWFKASYTNELTQERIEFNGHFALKR